MKNAYHYLQKLFLKSGVKINIIKNHFDIEYDSNTINEIYFNLMEIRETNYKSYLECLKFILVSAYDSVKFSTEFFDDAKNNTNNLTESEYEALERFIDSEEENHDLRNKLILYVKDAMDIESLDQVLFNNNELQLITLFISNAIDAALSCEYDILCYDIILDFDSFCELNKYLGNSAEQVFSVGLNYVLENEACSIVDLLDSIYIETNSLDIIYSLHEKIISLFLEKNLTSELAEYIHEVLWTTYFNLTTLEDDEITLEIEDFIYNYETYENFRKEESKKLITNPNSSNIFSLYYDNIPAYEAEENFQEDDDLYEFYRQSEIEVKDLVKKLIPRN